jgi:hypothetical protein
MGIYKFGNNTYPRCIRSRSNLGHIFREKNCVLWAGKYSKYTSFNLVMTEFIRRTVTNKTGLNLPLHLPGTGRGLKKSGKSNLKGSKVHIWHKL